MPWRRPPRKGSFTDHFEELVKHFHSHEPRQRHEPVHERPSELQEKIDIHARLFECAWELDYGAQDQSAF